MSSQANRKPLRGFYKEEFFDVHFPFLRNIQFPLPSSMDNPFMNIPDLFHYDDSEKIQFLFGLQPAGADAPNEYAYLQETTIREEIEIGLRSEVHLANQYVARNKNLTAQDCRDIIGKLSEDLDLILILTNLNFPADSLHELAMKSTSSPVVIALVSHHKNASEETKTIAALRRRS